MAETVLGGVIEFFHKLGIYDVLLPFLLVFTIMFAILERTQLFGFEEVDDKKYTKKNLNAMVSFVTAFLVVASSKLVEIITQVSAQLIVLLLLIVFFLMLVGTFYTHEEVKKGLTLEGAWRVGFMVFIAICLLLMFLNAIKTDNGDTWLEVAWYWLASASTNPGVAAIILIIALILLMAWVVSPPKEPKDEND